MEIVRGGIFLTRMAQSDKGVLKTRSVVVISNDIANRHSGTITVLPISPGNAADVYPFEVELPAGTANLSRTSKVKTDQIRTVHRSNIVKILGAVDSKKLSEIESALKIHLAL